MKTKLYRFILTGLFSGSTILGIQAQTMLPNGWQLMPAGTHLPAGDLPICMRSTPDNKHLFVITAGQSDHALSVYNVATKRRTDSIPLQASWYGMAVSADGKHLYVTGANQNFVYHFAIRSRKKGNQISLSVPDTLRLGPAWPKPVSPAGMALNSTGTRLFIVTKEDSSVYLWNTLENTLVSRWKLPSAAYACTFLNDLNALAVSEWGNGSVSIWNENGELLRRIPCGDNPNEIVHSQARKKLFVACADDNTVAIVDTRNYAVTERLNTAMYPNAPNGSTPNALAFNEEKGWLYVANADNNNIGVFHCSESGTQSLGFIPTAWYPTQVALVGNELWYCSGKGLGSAPNPDGPNPIRRKDRVIYQQSDNSRQGKKTQYIGSLFRGTVSYLPQPDELSLNAYTRQSYQCTPYSTELETNARIPAGNPIPSKKGIASPIKHVFYIIKENRTYDQVLSDIEGGDGDTSLLLFGEAITPNQHKLAREFVLLDHFYVEAEVSADGHNWSTAAYANDYTEKTWPVSYGGRGGTYDYEGQKDIAWPRGGFIWDHCKRAGVSFRTYGEFADDFKANIPVLENHFCPYFTSWDESVRDTTRFNQWKRDFDSLLAINKVPALNTLRFINDHTEGTRVGRPTPFAHVADNDYAVGLFIEYLSQSRLWDSSVVFILEDDAQNGPDHIDAHRSTAYVAGPHVKHGFIDHTPYSTSSMLRTMELILGLDPMSQYDAAATPMWRCFTDTVDRRPFISIKPGVDLTEVNKGSAWHNLQSEKLNLAREDQSPDGLMNTILWKAIKGEHAPLPVTTRAAWVIREED
jgi:DNA-binding beta-propeller fold protein YncE